MTFQHLFCCLFTVHTTCVTALGKHRCFFQYLLNGQTAANQAGKQQFPCTYSMQKNQARNIFICFKYRSGAFIKTHKVKYTLVLPVVNCCCTGHSDCCHKGANQVLELLHKLQVKSALS